jgi:hypothetical protein
MRYAKGSSADRAADCDKCIRCPRVKNGFHSRIRRPGNPNERTLRSARVRCLALQVGAEFLEAPAELRFIGDFDPGRYFE